MPMRKLKNYKPTRFMAESSHYSKEMADFAVMFIEQLCHIPSTLFKHYFAVADIDSRKLQHPQHSRNKYQQRRKIYSFC